jgi:hypothetical protein
MCHFYTLSITITEHTLSLHLCTERSVQAERSMAPECHALPGWSRSIRSIRKSQCRGNLAIRPNIRLVRAFLCRLVDDGSLHESGLLEDRCNEILAPLATNIGASLDIRSQCPVVHISPKSSSSLRVQPSSASDRRSCDRCCSPST